MSRTIEFPFADDEALPMIPVTLSHANFSVPANALLDSGSTVNLLPANHRASISLDRSSSPRQI